MQAVLVDAETILRFLLDDQPDVTNSATLLFESAEQGKINLVIDPIVICDCCLALQGKFSRELIAQHLTQVLLHSGVECDRLSVVLDALENYGRYEFDFVDAYLEALAKTSGYEMTQ